MMTSNNNDTNVLESHNRLEEKVVDGKLAFDESAELAIKLIIKCFTFSTCFLEML